MFIEIIFSITFFFLVFFSSIGYGSIFNKFIIRNYFFQSIGETGIYGLFFLCFISLFIHFFVSINLIVTSLICFFGLLFFLLEKNKSFVLDLNNFLIFLILLPTIIYFEYHADYFWYHLPYINITNEFKIIFGLSNLNDNLGYSHLWYDILF